MNDEGKAFFNHLSDGINDKENNTETEVVFGKSEVIVGNFVTSQIDIADIDQFNEGGSDIDYSKPTGATKQGKLIHELVEQHQKAKGRDLDSAHKPASEAEGAVNGNKRLGKKWADGSWQDTFTSKKHGPGHARQVFREKDGTTTTVIYKYTSGVISVVGQRRPTGKSKDK
ncbi:hypothetical protein [Fulvivirga ligni]|uniref:hypothetical protein n=1 Tax=Fulvivirga ligni TaxID=2904246 RepID=UPI001F2CB6BF|nr:hypothetical protein [Fulvivirga ligni]UII21156.1 hypothetical protein LVD16_25300 [Fulvivirga ligni]